MTNKNPLMVATVMLAIAAVAMMPLMTNEAFAATYTVNDRVKSNVSSFTDARDMCGQKDLVPYTITVSGDTRTLSWNNAPDTVTCYGESVSLTKVVVEFEKQNSSSLVKTINNPQSTQTATNYHDDEYSGTTEITLTYS